MTAQEPPNPWQVYWRLAEIPSPSQWAHGHLPLKGSPLGGTFNIDATPWLREPLDEFPSADSDEITVMSCVQGSKSTYLLVCATWGIVHAPGNMMLNCQTDDDARDFAVERFNPTLDALPDLFGKLPEDRSKRGICNISLPAMFALIQGANRNNLQSKTCRYVFNDELAYWAEQGLLDEARKRATKFWNRKIINVSTAGVVGDDLDRAFRQGTQHEYHLRCAGCRELFWPKWSCVKWEPQEDWDFNLLKASTYLECPKCQHRHTHTEREHRLLVGGGAYVQQNKSPVPRKYSARWNSLVLPPHEVSWGDLAVEWVNASIEFKKGNTRPRQEFIQKRQAESWDDAVFIDFGKIAIYTDAEKAWPGEYIRFLTVDVQETSFWFVVRAWAKTGESRLIDAGQLRTWEEVAAKREEHNVGPRQTSVDAANNSREVYARCIEFAGEAMANGRKVYIPWTALWGDDAEHFKYTERNNLYPERKAKTVLLPYSWPPKEGDPGGGTALQGRVARCPLVFWSNPYVKDVLERLRDGKGAPWLSPEHIARDNSEESHNKQMFSERKKWDPQGKRRVWMRIGKRPNHIWDCECMQVVNAFMAGILGDAPQKESMAPGA